MIRIVLADDHTIVREGLKQLLAAGGGFEVVGEADNGHEALQRVRERASLLGGTVAVNSAPGKGTRIDVRLPLSAQDTTP